MYLTDDLSFCTHSSPSLVVPASVLPNPVHHTQAPDVKTWSQEYRLAVDLKSDRM